LRRLRWGAGGILMGSGYAHSFFGDARRCPLGRAWKPFRFEARRLGNLSEVCPGGLEPLPRGTAEVFGGSDIGTGTASFNRRRRCRHMVMPDLHVEGRGRPLEPSVVSMVAFCLI
jgi:hypothetical protein